MNVQLNNRVKGFTIIEVVLVLAIAGLIFLMVFLALPALQASQRDTARKNDVGIVASTVNTFTSNNRGQFPTTAQLLAALPHTGTAAPYTFNNLSGNTTNVTVAGAAASTAGTKTVASGTVTVYKGLKCSTVAASGSVTLAAGSARQYVVITQLEAGNNTGYCLDS